MADFRSKAGKSRRSKVTSIPTMHEMVVDFEDPPVNEVVCGIAFAPMQNFQTPHMGLFWAEIVDEFPTAEVQPPLVTSGQPMVIMTDLQRNFYRSRDRSELVQVQQDRFLYNWVKTANDTSYPRYPKVVVRFKELKQ